MWQHWVNGILGIWIAIVPFLSLSTAVNVWVISISGLIIAVVGFWGAGEQQTSHESHA